MGDYSTIIFEVGDDHVATVTLNRPETLNSFNETMAAEVVDVWRTVRDTDDIHAVVLRAEGDRAFCTGIDVTEGVWWYHLNIWNQADPGFLVGPEGPQVLEARRRRGAGHVRGRRPVLRERVRHHHLLGGRDLLRSARVAWRHLGARAHRDAAPQRPARRRAALGAARERGTSHRGNRVAARHRHRDRAARGAVVARPASWRPRSRRVAPRPSRARCGRSGNRSTPPAPPHCRPGSSTPTSGTRRRGRSPAWPRSARPASADGVGVGPAPRLLVDRRGPSRPAGDRGVARRCVHLRRARRARPPARAPAARPRRAAR